MKPSIVPIIALLPAAAAKGIKVSRRARATPRHQQITASQQQQQDRDLYTTETIDLEEAQCCTGTSPTELEVEYTDDEVLGTNQTISPTEQIAPRPTYKPTLIETPAPTDIETPAPSPVTTEQLVPPPTYKPTLIETPEPTESPDDDGGLTDDQYISTPRPTRRPTFEPSGKPNYGYFPTDDTDDWAAGWMPTHPSKDDDDDDSPLVNHDDDTDDWHGGYPVENTVDTKASKGGKSGKSSKGGKSTKNYVTDDAYRGYGLSKVSSLLNSEVSSAYVGRDWIAGVVVGVGGIIVSMYL